MSDAAVDTSSEITTKDLKEKKEVVEEAENGREAPANGNANEENGEQEADNEVDEEEEEGGEEEEEEEEGDVWVQRLPSLTGSRDGSAALNPGYSVTGDCPRSCSFPVIVSTTPPVAGCH
ncbi:prothymosin alpha isoform X2 [Bubalus kerabau]|uniref:prothymosin alpha isoform X2 n=1 Tax=Bubalus carabanensis TaxID=3119969 RepID=UPI00244EBF74|nr:prothymosin alpha isoform X2 [Bubalus carabanensis]